MAPAFEHFTDLQESMPKALKGFSAHFDPQWFPKALASITGGATAKVRKRKLPPMQALWLVIGMALFRDRSIHEVAQHLELVLESGDGDNGISAGALAPARSRLGAGPVESLFEQSAAVWSLPHDEDARWRGLTLHAIDGSCFNLPDTFENEAVYGRPVTTAPGPYPQTRVAALLNVATHVLAGLVVGAYSEGELTLVEQLWALVPNHSLTIVDRGLQSRLAYHRLSSTGIERHWMTREKKNTSFKLLKTLGSGDELVELKICKEMRREHPDAPKVIQARRIACHRKGFRTSYLLTSLLDTDRYPASEVAQLYSKRWEIELAYDEVKNHMLEGEITLRSKTPEGVRQELYGMAIAYNLVRIELARVAREVKVEPLRMSFRHGLMLIRNFMVGLWHTAPGAVPRRLASLEKDLKLLVLPTRRTRSYRRVLKFKKTRYPYAKRKATKRSPRRGAAK